MAETSTTVYLNKQEFEWILESLHDFNLQHEEYDHRIYKMINKLREEHEKFQYCMKCLTPWLTGWRGKEEEHDCVQEEE